MIINILNIAFWQKIRAIIQNNSIVKTTKWKKQRVVFDHSLIRTK